MIPADLTAGDQRSMEVDWAGFELREIRSIDDPLFEVAYRRLRDAFGAAHEIEQIEVLASRLRRDPRERVSDRALLYKLLAITKAGELVGMRDHTAIVNPGTPSALIHMSHNLVEKPWRRSGIAGWLRALPLQTARECLAANRLDPQTPITQVAEMEHADSADEARSIRLNAYEKAGYRKIDPALLDYRQPDFRAPSEIDRSGGPQPLHLSLLVRRIGRESETRVRGAEVREIAGSLYRMYAADFRAGDMAPLFATLDSYPGESAWIDLLPPSAAVTP